MNRPAVLTVLVVVFCAAALVVVFSIAFGDQAPAAPPTVSLEFPLGG